MAKKNMYFLLGGLGALALGVFLFLPGLSFSPFLLLLLFCPLMMIFMMRGMNGNMQNMNHNTQAMGQPPIEGTPAERNALLKTRMAALQGEQDSVSREIDQLNGSSRETSYSTPPAADGSSRSHNGMHTM